MEYIINQVPLEMAVIPEHLFNLQFLSDVTFVVDGKQIYAHSLELMKRSTVFIKQLESTLGEKKLIPIKDYGYEVFYQFVRFIYTDICEVKKENCVPLLNLASEYKVAGLVNVVQKYNKIDIEFKEVPHEMKEISCKLFNLEFLSDITFIVEGQEIFAHSLELMKRSSVFQQQLEPTMGEQKEISINKYKYETFYQFIRFIYTDKCKITEDSFDLLTLAIEYKITSLINFLENSFNYDDLKLLNFCVLANDNIALFGAKRRLAENLNLLLASDKFLSSSSDTVAEILKCNQIDTETSELNIIDALVRWMKHQNIQNEIQFSDCRQKYDKLIRLIRFPILSGEELQYVRSTYPNLLTKNDFKNISGHILFGADYENGMWKCTPRLRLTKQLEFRSFGNSPTSFSVSSEMILAGLIIRKAFCDKNNGCIPNNYITCCGTKSVNIKISYQDGGINQTPLNIIINNYNPNIKSTFYGNPINLGSSVRIRPGFTYSIDFKYVYSCAHKKYWRIFDLSEE